MRRLNFNVTSTAITPNTADIGNEGEHNVTHLNFKINDEALGDIEYYRLSVGNFRSKKLYAEDSIVRFTLPMAALRPGVVLIQLDGYKTNGEEVTLVFKSGIISASVTASLCPSQDIPTKIKSGVESAINELENLVENGNGVVDEFYDNVQQVRNIAVEVKNISGEIEVSGDRAEEAAVRADNSAAEAVEYAAISHEKCEETKLSASHAQTYANKAQNAASSAEAEKLAAKEFSEAAEGSASQAETSANEAKDYMLDAGEYARHSEEMANNISGIVGGVVGGNVASSYVYKNLTPDWKFGDTFGLGMSHYVEFSPSDIHVGEKVTVRIAVSRDVYLAPDELPIKAQVNIGNPTDYNAEPTVVGTCNDMHFDPLTKTFYGSFTISDVAAQYDTDKPWVLMFLNHLCETGEIGSVTISYAESDGYYELREDISAVKEELPKHINLYSDTSPVWVESSNDEATQYRSGYMTLLKGLSLEEGKDYELSFSVGCQFQYDYDTVPPNVYLVKKTAAGEYVVIFGNYITEVADGLCKGRITFSDGVDEGDLLYLSVQDQSYVEWDLSKGELKVDRSSNSKEIISYLNSEIQHVKENKADKNIHNTVLRASSEDWQQSTVNDYPYVDGKYFVGKAVMRATNRCDIKIKIESEYLDYITEPVNATVYFGDYVKNVTLFYNEATGFFEDFFLYAGKTGIVDVTVAVEYPIYATEDGYAPKTDNNAVFGEAELYSTMPLELVIEDQNKNLVAIGGDIEEALDGIIAIQENLIGGDSE